MSHLSNEELITELKFLPCEFSRDELFSFVVVEDEDKARELKSMNKAG